MCFARRWPYCHGPLTFKAIPPPMDNNYCKVYLSQKVLHTVITVWSVKCNQWHAVAMIAISPLYTVLITLPHYYNLPTWENACQEFQRRLHIYESYNPSYRTFHTSYYMYLHFATLSEMIFLVYIHLHKICMAIGLDKFFEYYNAILKLSKFYL